MDASGFALPPGTLLSNYKLLKALGQGGFGITYIAWDSQLRRNIVLKECFPLGLCSRDSDTGEIIPLPHASQQVYRAAMDTLRKEAQTLASLNHERIVRVYDVFESHGSIFYVMPWVDGFENELSALVNWPTKVLKGWEQDANNYLWSKVHHASKSF